MRLIAGVRAVFGIGHLLDRIEIEVLLRRHERIMGGYEADEQNPRLVRACHVAQPLRRDIGNAAVILRVFAFARTGGFSDRRALAGRWYVMGKLFADRQLNHADAAGDVHRSRGLWGLGVELYRSVRASVPGRRPRRRRIEASPT